MDELLAMETTHRVDSLVMAMESALLQKEAALGEASLSPQERVILAIEALEREVNNGGYDQFFLNSTRVYAGEIEAALRTIGCPGHADIARRALAALSIDGDVTPDSIETAQFAGGDVLCDVLEALDAEYYACSESIEDQLFAFAKANVAAIHLRSSSAG